MRVHELQKHLISLYPGTRFQRQDFVEAQFNDDISEALLRFGVSQDGQDARLNKMLACRCHENSAVLAKKNPSWTLWFGFALDAGSDCWCVHSWCKNSRGRIIETTALRETYFGYLTWECPNNWPKCSSEQTEWLRGYVERMSAKLGMTAKKPGGPSRTSARRILEQDS